MIRPLNIRLASENVAMKMSKKNINNININLLDTVL